MRLKDRVAFVSGSASGIGQAITELFSAEGAATVGVDIDERGGVETRDRIRGKGRRSVFAKADVGSEPEVRAAVEAGIKEFGRIDVLANIVGIASEAPCHLMELSDWDRIIRVNLTSMFLTSKYVLPGMIDRKYGSIVHMSSVQGILGLSGYPHYAASKGGIIAMTRQMAREYASKNIRVNCIAPGTVDTPLNRMVLERVPDPKALYAAWLKMHPLGRLGTPLEIAYGALYLASDESSWVTGQCLVIDGGFSSSAPV
ncbi:MAG TPA: SDR family NAD(P)-dependent oxidoreductase [Candidatus Acidoferrum sp.]|nr:SDR family NAD(P)-dependent oxidoreductase [Candidatus Acidoferrum sp.]